MVNSVAIGILRSDDRYRIQGITSKQSNNQHIGVALLSLVDELSNAFGTFEELELC